MSTEQGRSEGSTGHDDRDVDALVLRARKGDQEALVSLLTSVAPALRRTISIAPQWRSVLDVDDVIQVTFTEAFLRFDQFVGKNVKSFESWIKKLADTNVRAAIRGLSSAKRPPPSRRLTTAAHQSSSHADLLQDICAASASPSRVVSEQEAQTLVDGALARLPEEYAAVVKLYYFEGVKGEDLGTHLRRSRGAAVMLLARARERLAEIIGDPSDFFSDSP